MPGVLRSKKSDILTMNYRLNHDAIIFLDSDAYDGYKTVAYDGKNDKMLEISPPLYFILKALESAGPVTKDDLEKLIETFSSNNSSVEKAVNDLVNKGIIFKQG